MLPLLNMLDRPRRSTENVAFDLAHVANKRAPDLISQSAAYDSLIKFDGNRSSRPYLTSGATSAARHRLAETVHACDHLTTRVSFLQSCAHFASG